MALVKCKECGKEISDSVKVCPNCGYKEKKQIDKKKMIICGAVLGIIIVITGVFIALNNKPLTQLEKDAVGCLTQYKSMLKNSESLQVHDIRWAENEQVKGMNFIYADVSGQNGFGGNNRHVIRCGVNDEDGIVYQGASDDDDDSWSELKAAFEDIKGVYDDLADAQSEMNSQGHLQVQTVLDLLDSDENYIQALYVENEQIKLKSNAEEIMNEVKLRGVQISLQQSIAEKELEKAQLESQLRALYGKKVYTEAADDTINATDNKITAFQAESDALADVTNSYLTLAQAELLANKAKLATNARSIASVEKQAKGFTATDTIKSI